MNNAMKNYDSTSSIIMLSILICISTLFFVSPSFSIALSPFPIVLLFAISLPLLLSIPLFSFSFSLSLPFSLFLSLPLFPFLHQIRFVTFNSEEDARLALLAIKSKKFNGNTIKARLKTETAKKSYFKDTKSYRYSNDGSRSRYSFFYRAKLSNYVLFYFISFSNESNFLKVRIKVQDLFLKASEPIILEVNIFFHLTIRFIFCHFFCCTIFFRFSVTW